MSVIAIFCQSRKLCWSEPGVARQCEIANPHQIRTTPLIYWITSIVQYSKGFLARYVPPPMPYVFPVNVPITARSNMSDPKSTTPNGHGFFQSDVHGSDVSRIKT